MNTNPSAEAPDLEDMAATAYDSKPVRLARPSRKEGEDLKRKKKGRSSIERRNNEIKNLASSINPTVQ